MRGCYSLALGGESSEVQQYIPVKENQPVVSIIYSCHVMPTHNNTPLNLDFLWIIILSQKKSLKKIKLLGLYSLS